MSGQVVGFKGRANGFVHSRAKYIMPTHLWRRASVVLRKKNNTFLGIFFGMVEWSFLRPSHTDHSNTQSFLIKFRNRAKVQCRNFSLCMVLCTFHDNDNRRTRTHTSAETMLTLVMGATRPFYIFPQRSSHFATYPRTKADDANKRRIRIRTTYFSAVTCVWLWLLAENVCVGFVRACLHSCETLVERVL